MSLSSRLVIRNGTIVDGTGNEKFNGTLIIDKSTGVISKVINHDKQKDIDVSKMINSSDQVVDANGLLVIPGWIDIHTHLDCQITFDPYMTPLAENGVTTAVMGNCGVGFAPCRSTDRNFLMQLMEGVEDIPLGAMTAGMNWEWETFPQFLDALDRKKLAFDIGCLIGHGPVRAWVMGERANLPDRPGGPKNKPITEDEMEKVAQVVGEAVAAGALGFSTSRTLLHRDRTGNLVPGTLAPEEEILCIGKAMADASIGVSQRPILEMASDFMSGEDEPHSEKNHADRLAHFNREWIWIQTLSKGYNIKVNFCLGMPSKGGPNSKGFRSMLMKMDTARATGTDVTAQVFVRPQGVLMCWDSRSHPFISSPTFDAIWKSSRKATGAQEFLFDKRKLLDPAVKAKIISETLKLIESDSSDANFGIVLPQTTDEGNAGNLNGALNSAGALPKMYLNGVSNIYRWSSDYEPTYEQSIEFAAKKENRHSFEVLYDWLCEQDGSRVIYYLFMNYATPCLDDTLEILLHDGTIPGLGDTGAHLGFLADPTSHTYLLTYLARDRVRGPKIRLESAVKLHTADPADAFGLTDRGRLIEGKLADINLIDFNKLQIHQPKLTHDLPLGAARWVQRTSGYVMTIKRGEITHVHGKPTGSMPGKLVRGPAYYKNKGQDTSALVPDYPFASTTGKLRMMLNKALWETEQKFIEGLIAVLGPSRLENLGLQFVQNRPLPLSKL